MNNIDINLNLYRSFYYVVKYEGFTKASEHILISQSGLSTNIKKLEDELNAKLFERTNSKIILTKYGKNLYSKLVDIAAILNDNTYEKKELNIGCLRFIADNYMSEVICNFKKENKDVVINFEFNNNTDLFQLLRRDQIDIVICRYPLFYKFEKNVVVEKIIDVENNFACSKQYYDEIKEKICDDYEYQLILPDSSEKRRNVEQYLLDKNVYYKTIIQIPNSNLLKSMILNNIGIGYINRKAIEQEILNGDIVILSELGNLPTDNITMIYNSKNVSPLLKSFIDILKYTIKKNNS